MNKPMTEVETNGSGASSTLASKLLVSVVIPVFNEEENVRILHGELSQVLEALDRSYEIIFVDDGSTDSTFQVLRALASEDPRLVVLRFRQNTGQTAAIQAGFDRCSGEVIVTMDGDLQNDPAEIPRLLELIEEGFDVASGWRRDRQDKAVSRRLPSLVANWLIGVVTGVHIHDNGCTLKAYRSEVAKKTRLYAEMHRFLVPMLSLSGCRITEVVVNHRKRRHGISKYGLSRVWKVLLDLVTIKMLLRFSSHPATWFGLLAFPFLLLCLPSGALSVYLYWSADGVESFPLVLPSIMTLSAFTAGNLLALGMFAELVVRTGDFKETDPVKLEVRARSDK